MPVPVPVPTVPSIGLEVWGADLARLTATAQRAEAAGIGAFYYGESPGPLNLDCVTVLAHLAARTSRIRLGPVIANVLPAYRSTLLLAKQAASLALASGGRFDLRTGVGAPRSYGRAWWEPWGIAYGGYAERLADLDRFLTEAGALWSGGLGFDHPPVPVTVAATGPQGIELAHRHARRWELSFKTPAEVAAAAAGHGCAAGTCPLEVSLEIDGFLATTEAGYRGLCDRVAADRAGEDTGALLARALHGTPAEAAGQIRVLGAAGVAQLVVALHDPHDPDALDALAAAARLAATAAPAPLSPTQRFIN